MGCFGDLEVEVCVAAGKGAHVFSPLCTLFKQLPQQDNVFLGCILCCQTRGLNARPLALVGYGDEDDDTTAALESAP